MRVIALEEHYASAAVDAAHPRPLPAQIQAQLLDLGPERIADLDAAGIDVQVLSLSVPGLQAIGAATAVPLAREENDRLADAVARHPGRLAAFAALPTADPAAAARELERTVREHGFKGALIHGQTDGRFLDERAFWPIFESAESLNVPVYLHPAAPPAPVMDAYYAGFSPQVSGMLATNAWGWHIETGLHVLRLVLAGVFDRFPGLQVVIGHAGEALPFMLARTSGVLAPAATGLPRTVAEYLREHVHITISGFFTVPPLLSALLEFGADRLLFAVDYPFSPNERGRAFLDAMPVSQSDREKIAHGNAERLLNL